MSPHEIVSLRCVVEGDDRAEGERRPHDLPFRTISKSGHGKGSGLPVKTDDHPTKEGRCPCHNAYQERYQLWFLE